MDDEVQNDLDDLIWSQQERLDQQRRREELIQSCKRAPLDPALLSNWTKDGQPF